MAKHNIEIVEELPCGRVIAKIEQKIEIPHKDNFKTKIVIKYTIADPYGITNIYDLHGAYSGIQFFDTYQVNELGDVIIGIKKDGYEYLHRVLSQFDFSHTQSQAYEEEDSFNMLPYTNHRYQVIPSKNTIEDIVPYSYSYNYGLINRNGLLSIYPYYDNAEFGNENTCIVGMLNGPTLRYGYRDVISGQAITPVCFEKAGQFFENRAAVSYGEHYGYLDRNKVMKSPKNTTEYADFLSPRFFTATDFENGEARVCVSPATHFSSAIMAKINKDGKSEIISPNRKNVKKLENYKN